MIPEPEHQGVQLGLALLHAHAAGLCLVGMTALPKPLSALGLIAFPVHLAACLHHLDRAGLIDRDEKWQRFAAWRAREALTA